MDPASLLDKQIDIEARNTIYQLDLIHYFFLYQDFADLATPIHVSAAS